MNASKLLVLVALLLFGLPLSAQERGEPLRPLILRVPDAALPVRLAQVKVEVVVVGRLAKTTVEMTFHNPNSRQLEGELQFPLLDGQQVSGFALDLDGKWRSAVAVEKARGQQVFEEVTRARIDPALLESTQGNNYKLRVYPIPAQGVRRVALTISERLPETRDAALLLRLPLAFAEKLESFDLRIQVSGVRAEAVKSLRGLANSRWENAAGGMGGAALEIHRRDYRPEALAEVLLPRSAGAQLTVEEHDGKQYFYAELPAPRMAPVAREKPAQLALVWDASGSGALRDHGREFALLDAYFKALGRTRVHLTLAREELADSQEGGDFAIADGDWSALRRVLEAVKYDGATNLAVFRPPQTADAVLLFSDGLGNFGALAMPEFKVPLFAVSASAAADSERLRHAAQKSGGAFVDLLKVSPTAALSALRERELQLTGLRSNGANDLVAGTFDSQSGRLAVAGVLSEPGAVLELEWRNPRGGVEKQQLKLTSAGAVSANFAAQAWAGLHLQQLLPEAALHQAEIVRLGKRFGLVTPGTSLIVLDRVEDYVRYEIVPPAELRAEYERLASVHRQQLQRERAAHIDDIAHRFKDKQNWWERDFPKGDRPPRRDEAKAVSGAASAGMLAASPAPSAAPMPSPVPAPSTAAPRAERAAANYKLAGDAAADGNSATSAPVASIQLKKWQPDSPYAQRLQAADSRDLYRIYLDERPGYLQSSAFFLDAADVFFARGQPQLALRVLSNLAEMDLENRHLLRILAYRLLQANRPELAVPILERVRELAPNEPQSWRDLGLAQAATGARQQALDSLYQVVIRPWHNRFPDIELIALAELNSLIATAPEKLDTAAIDPRFLRNLPLDLRVVLSWDADNTDIDLWVTDPNGEKTFYANRLSYQGGAMSRDFTGGYGPEEYSLKKAKPGKYLVQAQFYGHRQQLVAGATTLMLRLYTAYGTPAQHEEQVTLRLKGQSEVVTVGEFVVGK